MSKIKNSKKLVKDITSSLEKGKSNDLIEWILGKIKGSNNSLIKNV